MSVLSSVEFIVTLLKSLVILSSLDDFYLIVAAAIFFLKSVSSKFLKWVIDYRIIVSKRATENFLIQL